MLPNPFHFYVLLTLLFWKLKKLFNRWVPFQKYIAVCKVFLSRCLECIFVEGRQCEELENVDKIETFGYRIVYDIRGFLFVKCI
jgi:hypothetical protein